MSLFAVVFMVTATAIYSFGHTVVHILTAVPMPTQPSVLCDMVK